MKPRKRPISLETDVYRKLWDLEHKAYLRAHAWKKSYRYTLIDEYRQHITFAKNAYITGYEMLGYKLRFSRILPSDRIYHNIRWYLERTIRKAGENPNYAHYYKEKIRDSVNSYLGFLRHISGYKLRRKICRAIAASPLSEVFAVSPDYTKITIVPKHSTDAYYRQQYHQLKLQLP